MTNLQKQVKRLRKQIVMLSDQIEDDEAADDPIVQKIAQVNREIDRLNIAMRQAGLKPSTKPSDPQKTIQWLADELEQFGRKIGPPDVPLVTAVLELLVNRLDVDRDTKQFEMELAVPSWLGDCLKRPLPAGLDQLIACKPQIEAHPENHEILGSFRCLFHQKPRCFACRRAA